jgi:hypothetical protein
MGRWKKRLKCLRLRCFFILCFLISRPVFSEESSPSPAGEQSSRDDDPSGGPGLSATSPGVSLPSSKKENLHVLQQRKEKLIVDYRQEKERLEAELKRQFLSLGESEDDRQRRQRLIGEFQLKEEEIKARLQEELRVVEDEINHVRRAGREPFPATKAATPARERPMPYGKRDRLQPLRNADELRRQQERRKGYYDDQGSTPEEGLYLDNESLNGAPEEPVRIFKDKEDDAGEGEIKNKPQNVPYSTDQIKFTYPGVKEADKPY